LHITHGSISLDDINWKIGVPNALELEHWNVPIGTFQLVPMFQLHITDIRFHRTKNINKLVEPKKNQEKNIRFQTILNIYLFLFIVYYYLSIKIFYLLFINNNII